MSEDEAGGTGWGIPGPPADGSWRGTSAARAELRLGHRELDPSGLDLIDGGSRDIELAPEEAALLHVDRVAIDGDHGAQLLAVARAHGPAGLDALIGPERHIGSLRRRVTGGHGDLERG